MITEKDFIIFIESFNKKPGDYTDEEIYKIGLAHKSIYRAERNWTKLTKTLGVDKTGEELRSWVNYRQRQENLMPKNPALLTKEKLDDIATQDVENVLDEKMRSLYIQQTKTRDTLNSYRRLMRDEARIDLFKTSLLEAVNTLKALPTVASIKPYVDGQKAKVVSPKEAVLMFSDMHIGVNCDNFYNNYNLEVAKDRVSCLVQKTIEYCKLHKVTRLTVLNLGDMIEGIIHTSARLEAGLDVTKQIINAAEIIAQALNQLQVCAPEVIYRSVVDNHARVIADKNAHIEKENFTKIIDWFIEERLKNTTITFMRDNIDDGLGFFDLLNGKLVMFAHGHQDSINNAFQNFIGASGQFVHYVLLSHYHSKKVKIYQGLQVFVNGSIVGTEEYALSKRLFNKPSQTLLIFKEEDVLDITIDLNLQ